MFKLRGQWYAERRNPKPVNRHHGVAGKVEREWRDEIAGIKRSIRK